MFKATLSALAIAGAFASLAHAAPTNVLLLSVDTLRADRLGCYGYDHPLTPNIDALAAQGMLFEDAVCEVPLTAPSMGSMLTSHYPRMNGTGRNGLRLPEGVRTVTQEFKDAGYHTFCVQSNWTLKDKLSAIGRGFDVYDDEFHEKRWGFIKPERGGEEVTARALELLEQRPRDKPFFAWIHYSDPHAPYNFHKEFNPTGKKKILMGREKKTRLNYDTEVAFTDAQLGRILSALPPDTAVLFVADHGESLFEHDYLGHGRRIYQTCMHIPFIVRGAGATPGRSSAPVRGIDVGPTLLGLAGLPEPEGYLGVNVITEEIPASRARVIETYGGAVPNLPGADALLSDAPLKQGVLQEGWKLIIDGRKNELYNLREDPDELTDVSSQEQDRVVQLRALIEQWDQATARAAQAEEDLNKDDWEALEALGYLE